MQPAVIFDLDGTIIDSAPDIAQAINLLLEHYGYEQRLSQTQTTFHVGLGAKVLINKVWNQLDLPLLNDDELNEALSQFQRLYYPICSDQSALYDGVLDTLERLKNMGFSMAMCTNKPELHAKKIIDDYGLNQWISYCCGGDTFAFRKPDPTPLLQTIKAINSEPQRSYFIGDSEVDHQTAKASQCDFIFLSFGYHNGYAPTDNTKICHHFTDIVQHIRA